VHCHFDPGAAVADDARGAAGSAGAVIDDESVAAMLAALFSRATEPDPAS